MQTGWNEMGCFWHGSKAGESTKKLVFNCVIGGAAKSVLTGLVENRTRTALRKKGYGWGGRHLGKKLFTMYAGKCAESGEEEERIANAQVYKRLSNREVKEKMSEESDR